MTSWRYVHIGFEDEGARIGGLEVWKYKWRRTPEAPVELPHPAWPKQIHRYRIYEIGNADAPVRFAADELSNGVWGFYVPTY